MGFFFFFFSFYLVSLFLFFSCVFSSSVVFSMCLFSLSGVELSFSLFFDPVSFGFFSAISLISCLVFSYSEFYMSGFVSLRRFFWLVFGFVLSMAFLVFSGNLITLMVGWDGLGLISFCLVIFYSNHASLESGLVTVFSNRVGDVFFLFSFFLFFNLGGLGLDRGVFSVAWVLGVFIFLGSITKSAQVPFSAWLPAAMAAPTPVSSLVHSSTLVTAGVYVLIRFFHVFFFWGFSYMRGVFVLTMVLAGAVAVLEKDFKKVVAMSTLSQLGMMAFVLSLGLWRLVLVHMIIHAFFKSMLFLAVGSLMSHGGGYQDSRFFGGSIVSLSSFVFVSVSAVCLMGFPFYIGFYSKDTMILLSGKHAGWVSFFVFLISCSFTVVYSFRLLKSAYSGCHKSFCSSFLSEGFIFSYFVSFLFFCCWSLGGGFYWFFLSDLVFIFYGTDLVAGLLILGFCLIANGVKAVLSEASPSLFSILFMRWSKSSGISNLSKEFSFHRWDSSWIEFAGGQGALSVLRLSGAFFMKSETVLLGVVLVLFCIILMVLFF